MVEYTKSSLKRNDVKLYRNHRNELNSECHNIKRIEYLNKHKFIYIIAIFVIKYLLCYKHISRGHISRTL